MIAVMAKAICGSAYHRPTVKRKVEPIIMDLGIQAKGKNLKTVRLNDESVRISQTDKPWL